LPELGRTAAQYFEPTAIDSMVAALDSVIGDASLQAKMREKGLQQAAQFSWERAANETIGVYEKISGKRLRKNP
jgi:glycosyltransferase involved in cell wall biosynthesis